LTKSRSNGQRARLLKALLQKGVSFARLSATDLAFDGQAFVVFDGHDLRGCRDAAAAIGAVVRAKRWCSAVDLSAIRQAAGRNAAAHRAEPAPAE